MHSLIKVCDREIRVTGKLVRTARPEADLYHVLKDPEEVLEALRQSGSRADLFTFTPGLTENSAKYNYPKEMINLAVAQVSTYDNWWKNITSEARNRARQAGKRGVVLREVPFDEDLVKGIWEIYNETPIRQGRPFRHYRTDFETVYRAEATFLDTSIFIGAFLDDKLIGFVKLTTDEDRTQANLMNILSLIKHKEKAPTNALIAQSVRSCAERGISHLIYQRFSYGNKEWDGLMKFKQVNGFQSISLPRYYVPLTFMGAAAYRMGFHHRLLDRLPASMANKLREMRAAWYSRKPASMSEAS